MEVGVVAKKVNGADLRSQVRLPLHKVIPLSTPLALFIDTGNGCNLKCSFCPTGDKDLLRKVGRQVKVMSIELFRKIIDDLRSFENKIKIINLYKDGEPLVNRHFPEMVRELKASKVAEKITTKTNGLLITGDNFLDIANCGLDEIGISVIAPHAEGYLRIAGVKMDYEKFLVNIGQFYRNKGQCKVYVKMADAGFTKAEIQKFYLDFEDKCDFIAIENLHGWSMSDVKDFTLGTEKKSFDGVELTNKVACPWPFYEMGINSNGTVGLCNDDWAHKTLIGDVRLESLQNIWNGRRMFEMRKMHLEGRRCENEACSNCYYITCAPDNIDLHREAILSRLVEQNRTARFISIKNDSR